MMLCFSISNLRAFHSPRRGEGLGVLRRSRHPGTKTTKPGVSDAKRRIPLDLPLLLESALLYPGR